MRCRRRDVFLDPTCRNIYRTFRDLYSASGGERPPKAAEVMAQLGEQEGEVDLLAGLLLEREVSDDLPQAASAELQRTFDSLRRRYRRHRHPVLVQRIREADLAGDTALRDRLLDEKAELTRSLHPDMTGSLW